MFQEVKQSRLYEDIVYQIEEAIETGQLKPGDRLPPERVSSIIKMHIRKFSQYMKDRRVLKTKSRNIQVVRRVETTGEAQH